jgi:pimeloyl-ACP methyl ester carboxylesterase
MSRYWLTERSGGDGAHLRCFAESRGWSYYTTISLVLFNPHAAPADLPPAPRSGDAARERWGTRELSEEFARAAYPSLSGDPDFLRWHVDYLRFAASPGAAAEFFRMLHDTDITDVLPTIRVPTLVIYRAWRRDAALRVAELIPGARAVQISGDGRLGSETRYRPRSSAS